MSLLPHQHSGELTYGYPRKKSLEKRIVFGKLFEHFGIGRDVDEDGEGVLGYGRIVLDEELEILDGFELIALEEGDICLRVSDQMLGGCCI